MKLKVLSVVVFDCKNWKRRDVLLSIRYSVNCVVKKREY